MGLPASIEAVTVIVMEMEMEIRLEMKGKIERHLRKKGWENEHYCEE